MDKPDQTLTTNSFKDDQPSSTDLFEEFLHKCKQYCSPANEIELVIGKIRNKFANLDPLYRNSKFFRLFLIEKVLSKIPREPWQGMKILSDDLKRHANENLEKEEETSPTTEGKIHQQCIQELEKEMAKLLKKIKRLDKEEVDCSDEINSSYMRSSRYKKELCKLYDRISHLKNETRTEEMIKFSGTKIPALDKAIEQYCNSSKNFPDYDGILNIIKGTSDGENLGLSENQIHGIAENALQYLNRKMKTQRSNELHSMLSLYAETEKWEDPALQDPELNCKLLENQKLYEHKLDEVINEYVLQEPLLSDIFDDIDTDEEISEDEDEDDETSVGSISISDSESNSSGIVSIEEGIAGILLDGEGNSNKISERRLSALNDANQISPIQKECEFNGP